MQSIKLMAPGAALLATLLALTVSAGPPSPQGEPTNFWNQQGGGMFGPRGPGGANGGMNNGVNPMNNFFPRGRHPFGPNNNNQQQQQHPAMPSWGYWNGNGNGNGYPQQNGQNSLFPGQFQPSWIQPQPNGQQQFPGHMGPSFPFSNYFNGMNPMGVYKAQSTSKSAEPKDIATTA